MKYRIVALGVFSLFVSGIVSAYDISKYPFEKKIFLDETQKGKESVLFDLDLQALQSINENFSNILLVNDKNELLPFSVIWKDGGVSAQIKNIEVSSEKNGAPKALFDQDIQTHFSFEETIDQKKPATIMVDLGEPTFVSHLQFSPTINARINTVKISGGITKDRLFSLTAKRNFAPIVNTALEPIQFIKIDLSGFRVDLHEVKIIKANNAHIVFSPQQNKRIKFYYGGPIDKPYFASVLSQKPINTAVVSSNGFDWNKFFVQDFDKDGIENKYDNCPFLTNKDQSDTDQDEVGDLCDNAPITSNQNQSDVDRDDIGDLIDNCRYTYNPNQTDSDNDTMGDKCDHQPNITNKNTVTSHKNKIFSFVLKTSFILILLFFIGLIFKNKKIIKNILQEKIVE